MQEQTMPTPEEPTVCQVVDIQFRPGQKIYFFDPADHICQPGDHVIIDTARGPEYGTCVAGNHTVSRKDIVAPLRPVLRKATDSDEKIAAENQEKERRAFEVCLQKIRDMELDMQLVSAECAFDGSKLLFFFTADERVDFRDLVKSLGSVFHTRIELRQIGVRDKAKMVGGLGICGRPFCCSSFLDDFQPVSIKMAKTQNLSLNPTKISGTCGRLMCCLKYEQDAYEDLIRTSPKAESFVDTPDGRGTVVELDLLRQRVRVRMEKDPDTYGTYANADIAILRNGKAKKTDPPIPDDLAPISGAGKPRRKEETPEGGRRFLDSIRMRYSEETIAEETVAQAPAGEAAPQEKPARSERRRPPRKPKANPEGKEAKEAKAPEQPKKQPKAPQKPKAEAPAPAPASGEAAGEQKPRRPRRPNFRRRKPAAKAGDKPKTE